ncbi:MAG TPA: hypothetical protein VIN10_09770 [Bacteroidales bacterium]
MKPLKGAITEPEKATFSFSGWFSGDYQEKEETYLNESFGFRSWFIRINNQIAFSLFNKAKANGVIIGKENYLYEDNYIKAYYGTDFIGKDSIEQRMQRLKFLQDTLGKLDKSLIMVFAAGKGSFYPEFFPEEKKKEKGLTNYEVYVEIAKNLHLNFIDFNDYFLKNKKTSAYPLYPQFGIHWSYYGTCLAADSMIRYIEKLRNIDMPNLYWDEIEIENAHGTDVDIADGMNTLFNPRTFKMAYPKIQFQADSGKVKPSILVIADSYYWGMYNFGISSLFSTSHFWFYNNQVYPESFQNPINTSQINLKEQIEQHDIIIILATEATLPGFGWGFIEDAYKFFNGKKVESGTDDDFQKKLTEMINFIKTDRKWMETIEEKAALNNVSVDSMLVIDATWIINKENK